MPCLDDRLRSHRPGEGEVMAPKGLVTRELEGWAPSDLAVPEAGSLGIYREGQWHAHEIGHHYLVHMDRFDPRQRPLSHMARDAPEVVASRRR
jgi:hypothetical protein